MKRPAVESSNDSALNGTAWLGLLAHRESRVAEAQRLENVGLRKPFEKHPCNVGSSLIGNSEQGVM